MLGNRKYCYPLTITDYCSRYLLACESLVWTKSTFAFNAFERVKDYGLPGAVSEPPLALFPKARKLPHVSA
jgi:hypothetical protein